jgi:hypothetical protein
MNMNRNEGRGSVLCDALELVDRSRRKQAENF